MARRSRRSSTMAADSGLYKERMKSKKTKKSLTTKSSSQPVTNEGDEEEYEVESICAHRWTNEHQEYEYLLKWKGYGEEENSWVPASLMNCWDLLQCYLSTNIFNNPSVTTLSSPLSLVDTTSPKVKGHVRTRTPKRCNGALRNIRVNHTLHSTKVNKKSRLHSATKNRRVPAAQPEVDKIKKCALFSTPKSPPTVKLDKKLRKRTLSSSQTKLSHLFQPKKVRASRRPIFLPSPSGSPLLSSCDDMSSSQSECSVSVNDTFRLYLDSDEESNISGNRSFSVESPIAEVVTSEPSHAQSRSPKVPVCVYSSQQKLINGYKNSHLQLLNNVKSTPEILSNGKGKVLGKKKNQNLPSSTTHSTADNTDSDESWSRKRLRQRVRPASPSPSLKSTNLESSSSSQAEVSSTTSPPTKPTTSPLVSSSPLPIPSSPVVSPVSSGPLLPQRQSPNPEYQQELLEWQFMLNKQCRPAEAFILVENRIDEATIPWGFKYITSNMYGGGVPNPETPDTVGRICGCMCYIIGKRCGPKNEHCCPRMAGAEFPYSLAGKVRLPPGNPIYECNSRCSCPQDCTNRVVQHGRKINMSIFRTLNGRGWGVKTMEPIKPNTFVTEYVGEVVTTDEAERRGQLYDQEGRTYLFDLDFSCDDNAFTIDAAHYGNISHFFNHSCNPNLRVYSVWIDTLDERLPRIAFFSTRSISAGQELTFDYQMNQEEEGQVLCLCGQSNCCGYLY